MGYVRIGRSFSWMRGAKIWALISFLSRRVDSSDVKTITQKEASQGTSGNQRRQLHWMRGLRRGLPSRLHHQDSAARKVPQPPELV